MSDHDAERVLGSSHFRVLIGERELGFSEVSRLSSSTDLDQPAAERRHGHETVVLRRALTRSTELYDWRRRIVDGADDRRTVTIQQLESAGGLVVNAWRLEGAWPCRWSGPAFNAATDAIALEELELVFDELVWLDADSRQPTEGA